MGNCIKIVFDSAICFSVIIASIKIMTIKNKWPFNTHVTVVSTEFVYAGQNC